MWLPGFREFGTMQDMWLELDRLQREMSRLVSGTSRSYAHGFPVLNMWSGEDDVIVTTEIAGVDPKEIEISVEGDILTLKGARILEELKEGETYHRQERPHGSFSRKIRLPFKADGSKVDAKYEKGVLHIKLPRMETDKPRKITVKTG